MHGRARWCGLLASAAVLCAATVYADVGEVAVDPQYSAEELRALLTEREDENRVEHPWTVELFGRPLTATLQYELALDSLRQFIEGDEPEEQTRALLENQAEAEVFYVLGPKLSVFAQVQGVSENDLRGDTSGGYADAYLERGEMWVYYQHAFGLPLHVEAGRLDFEDDRRWWWDEDLDAVRVTLEAGDLEVALAAAQELGATRSDRGVEADEDAILRGLLEASWDWRPTHSVQAFALRHVDHSPTQGVDDIVRWAREDESDARLTWLGVRASGMLSTGTAGFFGYWLDAAQVRGAETLLSFEADSDARGRSVVEARDHRQVRGWGFDVGATWMAPSQLGHRLTLGYARGSGDANPDDSHERGFRQTGLNGNAAGFGGVQSFAGYGVLLDPELANLKILTLGVGVSPTHRSSVDLVWHCYRFVEPAESLRDARLTDALTGSDRDLGQAVDLVLAVEEWDRVELEFTLSALRAGAAFGTDQGNWTYGSFIAVRLAF